MVFVADADGVSFGFEILVFELNDKFSDVFCQFFVTQSIAELLLFELLTIFVRDGEYDRQVIGRDIPCLLSVADTDDVFVFRDVALGAFAIDAEAVGNTPLYNPYTGEEIPDETK